MTAVAMYLASDYLFYHSSARLANSGEIVQNKTVEYDGLRFKNDMFGNPQKNF